MRTEIRDKKIESASGPEASLTGRAAWILFAKTVAYGLSFALPLLLVRRLSQHEFGLYKQVFLVIGTAMTMLPLGFGMSAYYFFPRERERQAEIAFNILLFYTVAACAACAALFMWPSLLATIFNSAELVEYAPLVGVAILLWTGSSFLEMVALANQEAKMATAFIIGSQFSKALLLLVAAVWLATVESLIYAAIAQGCLQTVALVAYLKTRFPGFWRSFDYGVLRRQLSYSLPLGLAGLLFTMQIDLHNYFVSNRFGPSSYAIYAIGCFQLPLIAILSESICSVMIPRVSFLEKHGQRREIISLTARVMRKLSIIYFPLYAFLLIAGREFITVLFTERYLASWPIFAINITMLPVSILVLDPVLRAYAEQRYFLLRLRIALVAALLVALWYATNHFSLAGVISVVIGASLIERAVTALRMGRVLGVTRRDLVLLKDVGKVALATIAASIITIVVRAQIQASRPLFVLVICGAVFSIAYLAAFLAIKIPTEAERAALRRQAARLRQRTPAATLLTEGDYL